jgi:hypothetical protein
MPGARAVGGTCVTSVILPPQCLQSEAVFITPPRILPAGPRGGGTCVMALVTLCQKIADRGQGGRQKDGRADELRLQRHPLQNEGTQRHYGPH